MIFVVAIVFMIIVLFTFCNDNVILGYFSFIILRTLRMDCTDNFLLLYLGIIGNQWICWFWVSKRGVFFIWEGTAKMNGCSAIHEHARLLWFFWCYWRYKSVLVILKPTKSLNQMQNELIMNHNKTNIPYVVEYFIFRFRLK